MLKLLSSTEASAWAEIDTLRHGDYAFKICAWRTGWSCEVALPRNGRAATEYGQATASTLAKALSAALRDAGEETAR
jgi:hypothetical protein